MDNLKLLETKLWYLLSFCELLPNGQLIEQRKLVKRVNGLKIEIYPNEHPPPHFHIKSSNIDASFEILSCKLLHGRVQPKDHKLIIHFHKSNLNLLIDTWNNLRPSDCQVGIIKNT
jgi:hypothetical protein